MSDPWQANFIKQLSILPMGQLESLFGLSTTDSWPNAAGLNSLRDTILSDPAQIPDFVCQSQVDNTEQYYEQIILQQRQIPTRPSSWHDLFNGLVWLQFPKIKAVLNQQHVEDIEDYGLSPRSQRRNNLTHFDECGVIVTYQSAGKGHETWQQLIDDLQQHEWQKVFVDHRQCWGHQLNAFIFGHANLEMLLQPFIGLTGKCLPVAVAEDFDQLSYAQQLNYLDDQLSRDIKQNNIFAAHKPLHPLPLLGIPDVWDANKNPQFYQNTDYFRPKVLKQ